MNRTVDTAVARYLREQLAHRITSPEDPWRRSFARVPRHVFVPDYLEQDSTLEWRTVTAQDPRHLPGVYSDQALTTQVTDGQPTSSSSRPSLMLAMLHALDVRQLNRVLEVGTGTGYNAALLGHRLGDQLVTTVDVDPELTRVAGERLNEAGYRPHIRTGDGAKGVPDRGPFDRIIATCGLQSVPLAWIDQAADGAVVVVPIGWGVARLIVRDGRAEGRFLPGAAYFMPRRTAAPPAQPAEILAMEPRPAPTRLAVAEVLRRLDFPLSIALPGYSSCVWADEQSGAVEAVGIWTPDGSIAHAHTDGTVRQAGPRLLWETVEATDELFPQQSPGRSGFGITVTAERQYVWHAARTGATWDLSVIDAENGAAPS
ncbi:methyltransferase domain-containing protein [Streptomyces sp. NPDC048845]|uniref:methyltransferase domain-containing protein n=1 Tax=Streptomyces sp. NPDC048845 TaxID=3155390 RepID=UPI00342B89B4